MGRAEALALYALVFALPFNGLRPILDIGELSGEGFFYGSLLYMAIVLPVLLARRQSLFPALFSLVRLQSVYIFCILLFSLLSIETILANDYGLRNGPERFGVSLLTYGYYLFLSTVVLAHALSIGAAPFIAALSRAFTALGFCLALYCSLEALSWFAAPVRTAMTGFRSLFAIDPEPTIFRLSGVSLEPSFNAFALMISVPWAVMRAVATKRRRYWALAAALTLLCAISGARTSYAGLAAMAIVTFAYKGAWRRVLPHGWDGAVFVMAMFAIGLILPLIGFSMIDAGSPTSNVTRAYIATAAINAGIESVWGQGFGQVSFFVVRKATALIQYSWELTDFYYGTRHGVLPPLYSWYARTFGEFGIAGYLLICAGFSRVAARFFDKGHRSEDLMARSLFFLGTLLLSQFLAMALSIESIRMPQFWFAWIVIALFFLHRKPTAAKERIDA